MQYSFFQERHIPSLSLTFPNTAKTLPSTEWNWWYCLKVKPTVLCWTSRLHTCGNKHESTSDLCFSTPKIHLSKINSLHRKTDISLLWVIDFIETSRTIPWGQGYWWTDNLIYKSLLKRSSNSDRKLKLSKLPGLCNWSFHTSYFRFPLNLKVKLPPFLFLVPGCFHSQ